MGKGRTSCGASAFEERYSGLYADRWSRLRAALLEPNDAVEFREGLTAAYRMDSASIMAARELGSVESGEILDACAAPGGKSLVIASTMGQAARLVCNELSGDRARRLKSVLDGHLPPRARERVSVSCADAAAMCRANERRFDAILLDAPCSSERHVLASPSALAAWSPARVRQLASRQWALLSSCFLMLKPGGRLVYSTCSISPEENELVAGRLRSKYGGLFDELPRLSGGEARDAGAILLPDAAKGSGPMYVFSVMKRA
jgi:16S rRNA (cytosine1407-C5)-methyltransferase